MAAAANRGAASSPCALPCRPVRCPRPDHGHRALLANPSLRRPMRLPGADPCRLPGDRPQGPAYAVAATSGPGTSGPVISSPSAARCHSPPALRRRARFGLGLNGKTRETRRKECETKIQNEVVVAEDDIDGGDDDDGGLEALFKQLEDDLKNDALSVEDDDDEISEEDMARFEQVLAEAIGDISGTEESVADLVTESKDVGNGEESDAVERPELKNWQLRRLACALKIGRRKTSIKNLAGELGLERGLVIELLRNPPPKLLVMSDSLPDEAPSKPEVKEVEPSPVVDEVDATETKPQMDIPIHVMSAEWSTQKRLKKVQLETLERVYLRSKRPTNTMISSIVQVTSLPRKTIVKWFEDRREQDGVPDHRAAYKRPLSETIAS